MGKKVIRLTEKDIESLVGKIMSEEGEDKIHTQKWDRCVEKVKADGKSEESAYKICSSSIKNAGVKSSHQKKKGDEYVANRVDESLPRRERERKDTNFRRDTFDPYEREGQIMDIFGPYKNDVPPNVVSYMRKNPALIVKRLEQVYGREKLLRYLGIQE